MVRYKTRWDPRVNLDPKDKTDEFLAAEKKKINKRRKKDKASRKARRNK